MNAIKESLRERSKREKLARIRQAAGEFFQKKGFEATTTREIAERAGVGTGTLFLYVKDKYELLLLVFYDAIESTVEEAFATLPVSSTLLDELLHIFGCFLRLYAQDQDSARIFIRELVFRAEIGGYRQEAMGQIERFLGRLADRVEAAKMRGEIGSQVDVAQAVSNFFALYYATLTAWLSGTIELEEALNVRLRKALELQIKGLLTR